LPNQRFTTGKKHNRTTELSKVIQQNLSFLSAQLIFCSLASGVGIAVYAFKVTAASYIPNHNRFLVTGELE
jgi:hypothetical protein